MNPTYDFSGQVALVTGAAMGMGLYVPCRDGTAVAPLLQHVIICGNRHNPRRPILDDRHCLLDRFYLSAPRC